MAEENKEIFKYGVKKEKILARIDGYNRLLNEEESRVLQCITAEPITIEELAYLCRMPIAQLMPVLSMLELYGLVQQMIGRKYIRIG